ncbi:MAG TPA: DNA primase [Chloroflexia bacterium]|nr:DNA primase [Chloroflexia bacterium]
MPENDVIAEIKARVGIEDVVGETVRLTRAGRNLKGLCPFHGEKTPSFVVYPQNGSYHCFGCGENGDIFGFLMKTEGLDFRGALEKMAGKAGVELKPRNDQAVAEDRQKERLKEACAAASAYYHNLFRNHPAANHARAYAEKRGLTADTIEKFQVGFAPDSWDALGSYLAGRGYSAQEMVDAGLVAEKDEGGHYDRFRNRLMFPIRDSKGAIVGFGARALGEGQTPKYLNSPQSAIYDKSSILYGFDLARQAIQKSGQVVVVEGYMDVVGAHQAGQANVVASSGTALTDRHAEMLKRIAKRIVLCLDPDTAGDLAALKGSEVLQEHAEKIAIPIRGERGLMGVERRSELEIRIMQLPRGKDPDELLLEPGGPQQWEQLREDALPLVEHVIGVVAARHDLKSAHGKSDAVKEMALFVREIGDPVQRAHYAQRVASVMRVSEEAVAEALGRGARKAEGGRQKAVGREYREGRTERDVTPAHTGLPSPIDPGAATEEHLLSLVVRYPQVTWMVNTPAPEDFTRRENRTIYEAVMQAALESDKVNVDAEGIRLAARESLDPALVPHFDRVYAKGEPELFRFALPYELGGRLKRLRQHNDRMWLQQCQFMMQEAQETGDVETIAKLLPLLGRSFSRFRHYNPKPSTVFRDSRD